MARKGIRIQVFGMTLLGLSVSTACLARVIGFELDSFYIVIGIVGAGLFLYGSTQKHGND